MAPENAELLYLYGRCLFKVAVANSDVLGGKVAGERKPDKPPMEAVTNGRSSKSVAEAARQEEEEAVGTDPEGKVGDAPASSNNPFFSVTGMENWESDEEEDGDGEDAEEEEEDDFANAYEILDMARTLFERRLQQEDFSDTAGGKQAIAGDTSDGRKVKELLAETHDLQAEISLENEQFDSACESSKQVLQLKKDLYPQESEHLAEAHFKLSLALEYASVTELREAEAQAQAGAPAEGGASSMSMEKKKPQVDMQLRGQAADEMEHAIESCRLRIAASEAHLKILEDAAEKIKLESSIKEVTEIMQDMQQRLVDLRAPPVALTEALEAGQPGAAQVKQVVEGLLGQDATVKANDLTGLVKKKKHTPTPQAAALSANVPGSANGHGKRKAEAEADQDPKKVKRNAPESAVKDVNDAGKPKVEDV